jgi:hypothetical protein
VREQVCVCVGGEAKWAGQCRRMCWRVKRMQGRSRRTQRCSPWDRMGVGAVVKTGGMRREGIRMEERERTFEGISY